jgi:uncharacterized protein (DUF2147 family)
LINSSKAIIEKGAPITNPIAGMTAQIRKPLRDLSLSHQSVRGTITIGAALYLAAQANPAKSAHAPNLRRENWRRAESAVIEVAKQISAIKVSTPTTYEFFKTSGDTITNPAAINPNQTGCRKI